MICINNLNLRFNKTHKILAAQITLEKKKLQLFQVRTKSYELYLLHTTLNKPSCNIGNKLMPQISILNGENIFCYI